MMLLYLATEGIDSFLDALLDLLQTYLLPEVAPDGFYCLRASMKALMLEKSEERSTSSFWLERPP